MNNKILLSLGYFISLSILAVASLTVHRTDGFFTTLGVGGMCYVLVMATITLIENE